MLKKIAFGLASAFKRWKRFRLSLAGKTERDVHEERVVSGRAWDEFCDALKAAGAALVYGDAPRDPLSQAEGTRYLARLARGGLEAFIEHADPAFPELRRMVHETVKLGADNPDNWYLTCRVSSAHEYRLVGTRGTVHYLGFATQRADYAKGGDQTTGLLECTDIDFAKDGSFEVLLSSREPMLRRNLLPMTDESRVLLVRQTFLDRESEIPANIRIERVGDGGERPGPLSCEAVDKGLADASLFVAGSALFFARWANDFKRTKNELPRHPPEISLAAGGDPNIAYYHSYWSLGENEALVLEFTPPDCPYWNFHLNNWWLESLDYRHFPIGLNKHSAVARDDGSVRIVVAHRDPGVDNWVHTAHHPSGTMTLRFVRAADFPPIQSRTVSIDEVSR